MSNDPVRVFVRIRPSQEVEEADRICLKSSPDSVVLERHGSHKYCFDRVFHPKESQEAVFEAVKPLLAHVFNGTNVTVFAYGQTNAGKTHTINGSGSEVGLIPRVMSHLLCKCTLSVSYLEIYNDRIYDLLARSDAPALELRETPSKEILIVGLSSVSIDSMASFETHHAMALRNRSTASTNLNRESSRSHFILRITIDTRIGNTLRQSKLHLIDLAGSEDNKRTGNTGTRIIESGAINKSLFVLGQVVEALNKKLPRIPYRDSKITRLLQDSLGGSAKALVIACCAPESKYEDETFNTLNFALKSSHIRNAIVEHVLPLPPVPPKVDDRLQALAQWRQKNQKPAKKSLESVPEPLSVPVIPPIPIQIISDLELLKQSTESELLHILNNGSLVQLIKIKLIGKKRANDILQARENHPGFTALSQLSVIGLGPSQIESIFKANLKL